MRNLTSPAQGRVPVRHQVRRAGIRCDLAENSERPGPSTARVFPAFGARDEAFALGLFPGGLPRSSDGLRFLASCARTAFHRPCDASLAKNALALHLLLQGPESLIDIVVANEYLQMFSNRAATALWFGFESSVDVEFIH